MPAEKVLKEQMKVVGLTILDAAEYPPRVRYSTLAAQLGGFTQLTEANRRKINTIIDRRKKEIVKRFLAEKK